MATATWMRFRRLPDDEKIAWYENTNGEGAFGPQRVVTAESVGANAVIAADVDQDGDMDVLASSHFDSKISWHENTGAPGSFDPQVTISHEATSAWSVRAADIDGDGDVDVLSASGSLDLNDGVIAWYENTDGKGSFGPVAVISTEVMRPSSIDAADIDGDGDVDVVSASAADDKIAWYENLDGNGRFGAQNVITTDSSFAVSVATADIDDDDDIDVISASLNGQIVWHENTDGKGRFGEHWVIASEAIGTRSVFSSIFVSDADGDGDLDVFSGGGSESINDNGIAIAWYENIDGTGRFGGPTVITQSSDLTVWSLYAADLDGDGDNDLLAGGVGEITLLWFENTNGRGDFGVAKQISTDIAFEVLSVFAADLDVDGDMDSLSAARECAGSSCGDRITWYENTDGNGSFGPEKVISTTVDWPTSVFSSDVDGDGDLDVLSASLRDSRIAWYENRTPPIAAGDANRDFQFDQTDIVQVLQLGKYLSNTPATWEEGDWNGDGVFDMLDLRAAMRTGNYLQGPYETRSIESLVDEDRQTSE